MRRLRKPWPLAFFLLAFLGILGGLLYAPNNYDALAYRVPRVLHWLAAGQWHWIHTAFNRLNTRGPAMEWLSAPLLVFLNTDRWLFLPNVISFILLPGLVFGTLSRLGVNRRVAWIWMWLLPTGYCYALQVGGIGNDLFGTIYPLAALHFALRAEESRFNAALAILAAALATTAKLSNIPLVLPAAAALAVHWRVLLRQPLSIVVATIIGIFASALPTAYFNAKYGGGWTGAKAEQIGNFRGDYALRVANNSGLLLVQNLAPPIFPMANAWNRAVLKYMPASLHERLASENESGAADWTLPQFKWEVNAGIGTGLTLLLFAGFTVKARRQRKPFSLEQKLVMGAIGVAFLGYLANMALGEIDRLTAPYYPFVICLLLAPSCQAEAVRRTWWKALAAASVLVTFFILVITPPRPLWPAETLLAGRGSSGGHGIVAVAAETYQVNRARPDALAPLRAALPPGNSVIGMVTFDEPETSLWRPFGSRRVEHVTPGDTAEGLRARGIRCIAVSRATFPQIFGIPYEQWLTAVSGEVSQTITLTLKGSASPKTGTSFFCVKPVSAIPARRVRTIPSLANQPSRPISCGCFVGPREITLYSQSNFNWSPPRSNVNVRQNGVS